MTYFEKEDIINIASINYDWDKLKNKTLLISGGTGFIGNFICQVIKYKNKYNNQNTKIISISRNGGSNEDNIIYIKADIRNQINITEKIDYVLHLASNTHPQVYASDPIGTITTNIIGCINLLNIVVKNKAKFFFASSVEIYGNSDDDFPMNENYCGYIDCNNARSGYNESKRVCESLIQAYRLKYGVYCVIGRFARIFGHDKKNDSKAIAQFINKAILKEDIILKSDGRQRYSFCYIVDAVSAIFKLIFDGVDGEAYNISDDDENCTLYDYANFIASLSNKKVVFKIEKNDFASKSCNAVLDNNKIKKLGWIPLYSVKDGLLRTYTIEKEYKKLNG